MEHSRSLPYASSLCGACYEVCPVKINIPEVLIYLRSKVVELEQKSLLGRMSQEAIGMRMAASIFLSRRKFEAAQRLARIAQRPLADKEGSIHWLPGMGARWTAMRDLEAMPDQTFREWWQKRKPAAK